MTEKSVDFGGAIHVCLTVSGEKVDGVECISTRPADTARMFVGHSPKDLVSQIGTVYALCGRAQTIAALKAQENACEIDLSPSQNTARDILRLAEMLTQTAMRLCLHWPKVLGLPAAPNIVRACLATEAALQTDILGGSDWKRVGGGSISGVSKQTTQALDTLTNEIAGLFVENGLADGLRQALSDKSIQGFGALSPNDPLEQGALMRNWDHPAVSRLRQAWGGGLAARLEAGLCELREITEAIVDLQAKLEPDQGIAVAPIRDGSGEATVETVRGALTHKVSIHDGLISACEITAPTEANFAADGAIERGIIGSDATDIAALKLAAELHVLAVDPCVAFSVEIGDA